MNTRPDPDRISAYPSINARVRELLRPIASDETISRAARTACLLTAGPKESPCAIALLDPGAGMACLAGKANRRLLIALEKLAAQYLLDDLSLNASSSLQGWLGEQQFRVNRSGHLSRSIRRRRSRYGRRIRTLLQELGLPADYAGQHCLPLQQEAKLLQSVGDDLYGRPQNLIRPAAQALANLLAHAETDGVRIQLVSAYRSVDYQAGIIRRKLENGLDNEQILSVSAAPGFSEHHTGRAVDLTTPGCAVLEPEFEQTRAWHWLSEHAAEHRFYLTFPRDNPHRLSYEPWHWAWRPSTRA